jgi:hypothetical protein
MPQMLRDILERTIARQSDLQLVGDGGVDEAVSLVPPADVVVVGCAGSDEPGVWPPFLHHWPTIRVITLDVTGRHTCLYELRPYRTDYGELSHTELVDVIRASVESGAFPEQRPQVDAAPR